MTAEPTPDNHVRIAKIVPGSASARSELAVGDILLALNGSTVDSVATFLATMKSFKSGDRVTCRVQRDGKEVEIDVNVGDWPREQPEGIQVLYDAVETPKARLRSLLTTPIGGNARKLPAILFLQGLGCSSTAPGRRVATSAFEPSAA